MTEDELIAIVRIERPRLLSWIESGWLRPLEQQPGPEYSDADVARARLVVDLSDRLGVNAEGVDIILDLIDQMHGLRAAMQSLGSAIEAQPPEVRLRVLRQVRRLREDIRQL